jgi:hypothetical protein
MNRLSDAQGRVSAWRSRVSKSEIIDTAQAIGNKPGFSICVSVSVNSLKEIEYIHYIYSGCKPTPRAGSVWPWLLRSLPGKITDTLTQARKPLADSGKLCVDRLRSRRHDPRRGVRTTRQNACDPAIGGAP